MNKVASTYLIYGIIVLLVGTLYAILVTGPSKTLILALGLILIYRGIRARNQEPSERTYLTLIAALSPGVVHLTRIHKQNGGAKNILVGILLAIGFFGGIALVGLAVIPAFYGRELIGHPFSVLASSVIIIAGCYEISVISVNQYCDERGYPCSEEMFEWQYKNPSRLIMIVLALTIFIAIVLGILAEYIVSLDPE